MVVLLPMIRMFKKTVVDMHPEKSEYLLGYSTPANTATLVPAYRKLDNQGEYWSDKTGF
jgi:hypothetical protein